MSALIPPQHGAWAFLALPLALGAAAAPADPVQVLLAVTWVVAYPWSYAALGVSRPRVRRQFLRPFAIWSVLLIPAALALWVARPWLVWIGLIYAALFAVNVAYARRRDERSLANGVVFIVECAGIVPLMWAVAVGGRGWTVPPFGEAPAQVWILTLVCLLVLTGSTLHVKSLIRERADPRYSRYSRAFALASVPAAVGLAWWWGLPAGWWLLVPFIVMLARAYAVRQPIRAGLIGAVELLTFVLAAAAAFLAV